MSWTYHGNVFLFPYRSRTTRTIAAMKIKSRTGSATDIVVCGVGKGNVSHSCQINLQIYKLLSDSNPLILIMITKLLLIRLVLSLATLIIIDVLQSSRQHIQHSQHLRSFSGTESSHRHRDVPRSARVPGSSQPLSK